VRILSSGDEEDEDDEEEACSPRSSDGSIPLQTPSAPQTPRSATKKRRKRKGTKRIKKSPRKVASPRKQQTPQRPQSGDAAAASPYGVPLDNSNSNNDGGDNSQPTTARGKRRRAVQDLQKDFPEVSEKEIREAVDDLRAWESTQGFNACYQRLLARQSAAQQQQDGKTSSSSASSSTYDSNRCPACGVSYANKDDLILHLAEAHHVSPRSHEAAFPGIKLRSRDSLLQEEGKSPRSSSRKVRRKKKKKGTRKLRASSVASSRPPTREEKRPPPIILPPASHYNNSYFNW